ESACARALARETVEARAQPPHQPAPRGGLPTYLQSLIDLADLTHLRERRPRKLGKLGKQATLKQRRANRHAARWVLAELPAGLGGVYSPARRVSGCPGGGLQDQPSMPALWLHRRGQPAEKGVLFSCQACRLVLHADLIGARNVALRTLLSRWDWV